MQETAYWSRRRLKTSRWTRWFARGQKKARHNRAGMDNSSHDDTIYDSGLGPRNLSPEAAKYKRMSHHDFGTIKIEGLTVPVILLDAERYERIVSRRHSSRSGPKPIIADTNLDILRDGRGNVFVNINVNFDGYMEQFTIDASEFMQFFDYMLQSSMFALGQDRPDTFFVIQLPQPQSIEEAISHIRDGLRMGR